MSDFKDDGSAAFPSVVEILAGDRMPDGSRASENQKHFFIGMTLRDYFACSAMNAELISSGSLPGPAKALAKAAMDAGRTVERHIAWNAYCLADAMLAERAKN